MNRGGMGYINKKIKVSLVLIEKEEKK